jgi:hypothetical protein
VDQRERWQALQSHLTTARGFVDGGDRAKALEAIDAALAIDPDFLAAQSLRDRILAPPEPAAPVPPPEPAPAVSTEGYAKFEARAKRRRVDRRVDAARAAIEHRRVRDAANALDEIGELDPNLPELAELTASFVELRRDTSVTRRGPWLAAAASFAVVLFGATWLQETRQLASVQTTGLATLVAAPAPALVVETAPVVETEPAVETELVDAPVPAASLVMPTRGRVDLEPRTVAMQPREEAAPEPRVVEAPFVPRTRLLPAAEPALPPAPVPAPAATPASMSLPISSAVPRTPEPAVAAPVPPVQPQVDEVGLVRQVLQRYRTAYDGLDAQSAQAVFPAVNQAALARAFDGLESQTLTFDACDVQLRGGESAVATCRGSARYVPKIGSREPRVEPRVWNFSLHKSGTDWTIDSARAER